MIEEKALYIDSIPCLVVVPTEDVRGVVIFYHGCRRVRSYSPCGRESWPHTDMPSSFPMH